MTGTFIRAATRLGHQVNVRNLLVTFLASFVSSPAKIIDSERVILKKKKHTSPMTNISGTTR